jgi:hypothetical protein
MNIQGLATRLPIAVAAAAAITMLYPVILSAAEPGMKVDTRTLIVLDSSDQSALFHEMRTLLANVQVIIDGVAKDNFKAVARAARASGVQSASEAGAAMEKQLPKDFNVLGMSMHKEFDAIAVDAEKGRDAKGILTRLAITMQKCNACHVSYQVREKARSIPKK